MNVPFTETLLASDPHPSLGEHAQTYGRLIGSWTGEVLDYLPDGTVRMGPVEIHFAWVLEGRAVQDVWIAPPRAERQANACETAGNRYGTTIRMFDRDRGVWQVACAIR